MILRENTNQDEQKSMDSLPAFDKTLVLASQSPRRAEILDAVGWKFTAIAANIDETRHPNEHAVNYVQRLARTKAETVASQTSDAMILGADTVVVVDDEILGQPRDDADARRMLRLLGGRWHEVLTGVALLRRGASPEISVDHETTRVRFAALSASEIDWYVASGEPHGKAGAYGIQGRAALFIEEIQGDYFNVVGLPVRLVYELAQKL
jgi:septum formation protein